MLIVSKRLKDIIERNNARTEFFEVVLRHDNKCNFDYYFMNLLESLDCIDQKRTIRYDGEGLYSNQIRHLAIDLSRVGDAPLFKILGTIEVGASDKLAMEIQKTGCVGVEFKSPEDWQNIVLSGL